MNKSPRVKAHIVKQKHQHSPKAALKISALDNNSNEQILNNQSDKRYKLQSFSSAEDNRYNYEKHMRLMNIGADYFQTPLLLHYPSSYRHPNSYDVDNEVELNSVNRSFEPPNNILQMKIMELEDENSELKKQIQDEMNLRMKLEISNHELSDKLGESKKGLQETRNTLMKVQQATEILISKRDQKENLLQKLMNANKDFENKILQLENSQVNPQEFNRINNLNIMNKKIIQEKDETINNLENQMLQLQTQLLKIKRDYQFICDEKNDLQQISNAYQKKIMTLEMKLQELNPHGVISNGNMIISYDPIKASHKGMDPSLIQKDKNYDTEKYLDDPDGKLRSEMIGLINDINKMNIEGNGNHVNATKKKKKEKRKGKEKKINKCKSKQNDESSVGNASLSDTSSSDSDQNISNNRGDDESSLNSMNKLDTFDTFTDYKVRRESTGTEGGGSNESSMLTKESLQSNSTLYRTKSNGKSPILSEIDELTIIVKQSKRDILAFTDTFVAKYGRKPDKEERKLFARDLYNVYHQKSKELKKKQRLIGRIDRNSKTITSRDTRIEEDTATENDGFY